MRKAPAAASWLRLRSFAICRGRLPAPAHLPTLQEHGEENAKKTCELLLFRWFWADAKHKRGNQASICAKNLRFYQVHRPARP
jgi:hypothetical protein